MKQPEANYDSVLDTMTNVVGILVIVLTVTHLCVGDAVRSTMREHKGLPEVSVASLDSARAEESALRERLDRLRRDWGPLEAAMPRQRVELREAEARIAELRAELEEAGIDRQKLNDLAEQLATLERRAREVEEALRATATRSDALEEQLAAPLEHGGAEVSLPSPDPSRAKGKQRVDFLCRHARLLPFHRDELVSRLGDEFKKAQAERVAAEGKFNSWEHMFQWAAAHFAQHPIQDDYIAIEVKVVRRFVAIGSQISPVDLRMEWKPRRKDHGDTVVDLEREDSLLRTELARLDAKRHWLYFSVFDDSFDLYLRARTIAEARGFAVGWIAWGRDESHGGSLVATGGGREAAPD